MFTFISWILPLSYLNIYSFMESVVENTLSTVKGQLYIYRSDECKRSLQNCSCLTVQYFQPKLFKENIYHSSSTLRQIKVLLQ